MKKIILFLIVFATFFIGNFSFAQDSRQEDPLLDLYFFYSPTCPHCHAEHSFLDKIEDKYPNVRFNRYSVFDSNYQDLLKKLAEEHEAERFLGSVPLTFVGEYFHSGFNSDIGKDIELSIQKKLDDINVINGEDDKIYIPFIGKISKNKFSLPLWAIILGILDGFNVCSLGALMLILGLVLTLQSRTKILFYGGIFLATTALIYGLLIVFWYKLFLFISWYMWIMELAIAFIGVLGGAYFIKEFIRFKKNGPTCDSSGRVISSWSTKVEKVFKEKRNWLSLAGVVLIFAAVVVIVEFPCSAAVPLIFAGMLSKAGLSQSAYIFYISIFLFFYLLDEIIIFIVAVWKLDTWMTSANFVTWAVLAEGIILLSIGFYYLYNMAMSFVFI